MYSHKNLEARYNTNREQVTSQRTLTDSTAANSPVYEFKIIQQLIGNLFSRAKHIIQGIYQQVIEQVSKLTYIINKNSKVGLFNLPEYLLQIKEETQQKMKDIYKNLRESLITKNSFKHFGYTNQKQQLVSHKQIPSKNGSSPFQTIKSSSIKSNQLVNIEQNRQRVTKIFLVKNLQNTDFLEGFWPNLQQINLQRKNLYKIINFSQVKCSSLTIINLAGNNLKDIRFLKGSYFPILQSLNLAKNKLRNLYDIQCCNFPCLKVLNISGNLKLTQINSLSQAYFPQLIHLDLSQNQISNIQSLKQAEFSNLQILNLDKNTLSNIDILSECKFPNLKILSFSENKISQIKFMSAANFANLQGLFGHTNQIVEIDCLCKTRSRDLRDISLHTNKIVDFSKIKDMQFPKLQRFDLTDNNVKTKNLGCFETHLIHIKKAKKKFPFILL